MISPSFISHIFSPACTLQACVSCKNCKIDEESEIDDVVEPEIDDKTETEIVVPPKNWRHFDSKQKRILTEAFEENPWPKTETKKELSEKIGIKIKGVSSWFERTRHKYCIKRTITEVSTFQIFKILKFF